MDNTRHIIAAYAVGYAITFALRVQRGIKHNQNHHFTLYSAVGMALIWPLTWLIWYVKHVYWDIPNHKNAGIIEPDDKSEENGR